MISYKDLKIGDKIIITGITGKEIDSQTKMGRTAEYDEEGVATTLAVLKYLIESKHVLEIYEIDEYGYPWYKCEYKGSDGQIQEHFLAVMDGEWSYANK